MLAPDSLIRNRKAILAIGLSWLLLVPAHGQQTMRKEVKPIPHSRDLGETGDGIVGLVVNQTLSARGYDFYQVFSLLWSEKPESGMYSLSVQERLPQSKRQGNQVGIFLGQKLVFRAFLPQKHDGLAALCERAVDETLANIVTLALESASEDIVKEEM